MSDYRLDNVLPANDDTFMVMREFLGSDHGSCYRIARVYAFGVMKSAHDNLSNFLAPIDGGGHATCENTIGQEVFVVRGCDASPNGKAWKEIFDAIVPTGYDVRELPQGIFDNQYDPEKWRKHVA